MSELLFTCSCGHTERLPVHVFGSNTRCAGCGAIVMVSNENTRTQDSLERKFEYTLDHEDLTTPRWSLPRSDVEERHAPAPKEEPKEESQNSNRAPFDAEMVKGFLDDTPAEQSSEHPQQPIQEATIHKPTPAQDVCCRCKNPFRGPWDRIDDFDGTVCNICANQAADLMPGATPARTQPKPSAFYQQMTAAYSWTEEKPVKPTQPSVQKEREWPYDKILFAIIAVIVIIGVAFWPSGKETVQQVQEPVKEVSSQYNYAIYAIQMLLRLLGYGLTLYLTLHIRNKLPNDTFIKNIAAIAIVMIFVSLLSFIPYIGVIAAIILLYKLYEFDFGDVLYLTMFLILTNILILTAEKLILGALGLALT